MTSSDSEVPRNDTRLPTWLVIRAAGLILAVVLTGTSLLIQHPLPLVIGVFVGGFAVATATLLRAIVRLEGRVQTADNTLNALHDGLRRIEHELAVRSVTRANVPFDASLDTFDLADLGRLNLAEITAATLDRTEYPRLANKMDDQPPAQAHHASLTGATQGAGGAVGRITTRPEPNDTGLANRNLLRSWKVALREGDLPACRTVFAALVDTARPDLVAEMRRQIESLAYRIKLRLRADFAATVRRRDYAAALEIGNRIAKSFADGPIAEEYERLEPHLRRRHHEQQKTAPRNALRLAP